jgi:hypothetical protein
VLRAAHDGPEIACSAALLGATVLDQHAALASLVP